MKNKILLVIFISLNFTQTVTPQEPVSAFAEFDISQGALVSFGSLNSNPWFNLILAIIF